MPSKSLMSGLLGIKSISKVGNEFFCKILDDFQLHGLAEFMRDFADFQLNIFKARPLVQRIQDI